MNKSGPGRLCWNGCLTLTLNLFLVLNPANSASGDVIYPANSGVLNVKSYGAAGNGITDDTAAIQAAVAAGMQKQGSVVYFPSGTYLVSDTIWWATFGTTPAQATANVDTSRGCITGISVQNGGHGYYPGWNGGVGVLLTGGGGSGADVVSHLNGDSISYISVNNGGCSGHGYSSAPKVRVVNWHGWLRFQGQNQTTTTIKLKDNTPGFGNANCLPMYNSGAAGEYCRAVLYLASSASTDPTGAGENGYYDDVYDLTIDTGNGNAGAEGIDWNSSNTAAIRNVTIAGAGRVGLNTARGWGGGGNGPALVKNLTVGGSFDYGVVSGSGEVGLTFEHIRITNPRVAGFWNKDQNAWVRDLNVSTTAANVPGMINQDGGNMTVIDSTFTASNSGVSAILNQGASNVAWLHARNVSTNGYISAIRQGSGTGTAAGTVVAGTAISEYSSNGTVSLFPSSGKTLNLPVSETPAPLRDNNFANWANVADYGAVPNGSGDSTPGIQAALNSGKPTVFMPNGVFKISSTLHIPSSVRRIIGVVSQISIWSGQRASYPVFSCEATSGGPVDIRGFIFDLSLVGSPTISNSCTVPLVLADIFNADGYTNTPGTGQTVYFENAAIPGGVVQHGGQVWARQLDVETGGSHVINDGAKFWVLGYKTEGNGTSGSAQGMWLTQNAGFTEILGAFNSTAGSGSYLGYFTVNSSCSIAGLSTGYAMNVVLTETKSGTSAQYSNNGARAGGSAIPLYSGGQ
jgi:hypothetical protein